MKYNHRNFIIISKHKRLTRLWQFFFTGWGLVMVAVLVAASLFTKQILWTPISAINLKDVVNNQFKMTNAVFYGVDKEENPFTIKADIGRQEYDKPDIIFLENPSGTFVRNTATEKITDNIKAISGKYNRKERTLFLKGNVKVDSSNGDKIRTKEMVIRL